MGQSLLWFTSVPFLWQQSQLEETLCLVNCFIANIFCKTATTMGPSYMHSCIISRIYLLNYDHACTALILVFYLLYDKNNSA